MSQSYNRRTTEEAMDKLRTIGEEARAAFSQKQAVREVALRLSRETIRRSANSIRATHRGEFQEARQLLEQITALVREMEDAVAEYRDIYFAGFVEDAQKEYAEASATLAFAEGSPLPGPKELRIGYAAYLNGLGEAVGELRRYILDSLRRGDTSRCEELLALMDEAYTVLVTMDFPDALTRGLRRTTDMVRGVLERTRGDLTMALRQTSLESKLAGFEERVKSENPDPQTRPPLSL